MNPVRPIFTLSFLASANQKTIKNSHHFSFSTLIQQNPPPHNSLHRQRDEHRSVQVSVWWDFENCNLPSNANVFRVTQCINNALRANGIKGPIRITAFGDVMQISRTNQEALSATGISLTHVPSGGKNSADRSLLVDLMYWVSQNPPPAHLFLISGDRDFAGILHRLRMNNYNILLASPDSAPSVLCSAATIMWQWSSLLKGENLTGKLFNQPPDGPYNSWYGYYKAPLEDPFAVTEQQQPTCFPTEESSELASDSKLRPIPKAVVKQIRHILNSYPEGIAITQLRAELGKIISDKDFYGYKKFSRLLLAMPHVLKLDAGNGGLFFVHGVNSKSNDESVSTDEEELEVGDVQKPVGEKSCTEDIIGKPNTPQIPEPRVQAQATNLQEAHKEGKQNEFSSSSNMQDIKVKADETNLQDLKREEKGKESPPMRNLQEARIKEKQKASSQSTNLEDIKVEAYVTNSLEPKKEKNIGELDQKLKVQKQQGKDDISSPVVEVSGTSKMMENQLPEASDHSYTEIGIFRRIWMKWFGSGNTDSSEKNCDKLNGMVTGTDKIDSQSAGYWGPALFSPSSHEALIDGKFFTWVGNADTEISSTSQDSSLEKNYETLDTRKDNPKQVGIFSNESFWKELESFIGTSSGSALLLQSRNREHLVQNLQKQGPSVVRSLPESDLLRLVDDMISEKKWLEECNSRVPPFKLTRLAGKDPLTNRPLNSNGLSHFFSGGHQNLRDFAEKKHQNPPYTGVPQPSNHKSSFSKQKSEILADCQKLVEQIIKDYPEGCNMGCFRRLFLEKYGYPLDLQKLGYEKLVNLLQIMPGVRIESCLILPAGPFKNLGLQSTDISIQESNNKVGPVSGESSCLSSKEEDSDSSWDELGPLNNSKKEGIGLRFSKKGKKVRTEQRVVDYEPLEEDEFSDSDEETSKYELKSKAKRVDSSSLLQILDSWHSKEGDSKKEELAGIENVLDSSDTGKFGTKNESTAVNPMQKQKSGKTYDFVTEEPVDNEDKLVEGILGSMKKSSGRSGGSRLLG